jgi:hypothetical protein
MAWEFSGRPYQTIPADHTGELVRRINRKEDFMLLDVRKRTKLLNAKPWPVIIRVSTVIAVFLLILELAGA